uniref:Fatty-acid and retinol-binding protein 1 n=1 Tax=Parastrongyloides trichosuri TaxID=131310 RepID=A0A0N4ZQB7_PARTI
MKQKYILIFLNIAILYTDLLKGEEEPPNILLALENNSEFLKKATKNTIEGLENIIHNVTLTPEEQTEAAKKLLSSDNGGLFDKVNKTFTESIIKKLTLIRSDFESKYPGVYGNLTDANTKLVAETLASVIRNTSLSLSEIETKIKTIFENIEPQISDQLKTLIPQNLNLDIHFKSKSIGSKIAESLKSIGAKIKNFFSGKNKNEENGISTNYDSVNVTSVSDG